MILPVVRQDEDIMSREKLAGLVRERRKALGLTQPQVAERGDVSVELVRRVETNRSGDLRASKIEGLERALEWEPGSIRAVLNGGTPTDVHRDPDELVPPRRAPATMHPRPHHHRKPGIASPWLTTCWRCVKPSPHIRTPSARAPERHWLQRWHDRPATLRSPSFA